MTRCRFPKVRRRRGTRPTWVRVPHLPLHKALLSKAEEVSAADDHVVDDFHVNEFQAADHPFRNQLVRLALVTDHRRMIMKQYDRGCAPLQDQLDDLAWVHARSVNRSTKE